MTLPFYPFYWGDYSAKTFNLTNTQHGIYLLLLRHIYTDGEPIATVEQCYSIAKATLDQHRDVDFILLRFFLKEDGVWTNKKAENVKKEWEEKHQRRVIAAQKPRKQCLSNAIAMPQQPEPEPEPEPKKEAASERKTASRDAFEETDAALRKIEGVSEHPIFADPVIAPIWQLVQQGLNLKTQIIPSIARQLKNAKGKRITRWSYFVPGILEDNKITNAMPPIDEEKWKSRLVTARKRKTWGANWGPFPNQSGCLVPNNLLEPGDGTDWKIWDPNQATDPSEYLRRTA